MKAGRALSIPSSRESFLASGEKEALLPGPTLIPDVFPGRTHPGMKEVFYLRQGKKTFGWIEILKAVLRRLSFIVLQTEKRCLWKKEIWKSFWEGLPSGYTKILQP